MPDGGRFDLQPVHVADVADGLVKLVNRPSLSGEIINFTGAQKCTLAEYLGILRQTIHNKKPMSVLGFPVGLMKPILPLTNILSNGMLGSDNITLLKQGSCADNSDFSALIGRQPLAAKDFAAVA